MRSHTPEDFAWFLASHVSHAFAVLNETISEVVICVVVEIRV